MEPLNEAGSNADLIRRRDAVRRVTGYFRMLGLNDRTVLAEAVRTIARRAEHQGRADPTLLVTVALDEVDRWIDTVAKLPGDSADWALRRLGVCCRLKQALAAAPSAFLKTDNLPAAFVQIVFKSAPPAAPPPCPTEMQPTPFGKQPTILRYEFWLWMWRRSSTWLRGALGRKPS
jgi:hypothetical protein